MSFSKLGLTPSICLPLARLGYELPTPIQAARLFDFIKPALVQSGDVDVVTAFLRRLDARGTGAERQRATAARCGALTGVVDDLIAQAART